MFYDEKDTLDHYKYSGNSNSVSYAFFDMDGDNTPELIMRTYRPAYIFKYIADKDEFIVWYKFPNSYMQIIGTSKIQQTSSVASNGFCRNLILDKYGDIECELMFFSQGWHTGDVRHIYCRSTCL